MERFLEEWISGWLDPSEQALARFGGVLAPSFHIVGPTGAVLDATELREYMRRQHGTDPETTRWVENSRLAHADPGLAVVIFDEWQVRDGQRKGSVVSAIFRAMTDAPNGVQWIHIHEVPLKG